MRTALLAAIAASLCLAATDRVQADELVFDPHNFANTWQEVVTAGKELAQLQQQLEQLQQTYQMFTNPTNIVGLLPALNAPSLQNPMPAAGSLPGQVGGTGPLSARAQQFFSLNHVFTATGGDPQATLLNRSAISVANVQALAQANLQSIEQRLGTLNDMQAELQGATDIKQVAAVAGRIAIESNAIQGQQAQAANLTALAAAQAEADRQAQLQAIRQGHEQAAAQFTGTLN